MLLDFTFTPCSLKDSSSVSGIVFTLRHDNRKLSNFLISRIELKGQNDKEEQEQIKQIFSLFGAFNDFSSSYFVFISIVSKVLKVDFHHESF